VLETRRSTGGKAKDGSVTFDWSLMLSRANWKAEQARIAAEVEPGEHQLGLLVCTAQICQKLAFENVRDHILQANS